MDNILSGSTNQFRVCFIWTNEGPKNVEIIDYH